VTENASNYKLISLAELRALGKFVRWQEIPECLGKLGYSGESYPILPTWGVPAKKVDIQIDNRWRCVEYLGADNDEVRVRLDTGPVSVKRHAYLVAPGGYFSSDNEPPRDVDQAELNDRYRPPQPQYRVHSAEVVGVDGPYVTFHVKTYNKSANWVEESDMWQLDETFHYRDPRVDVAGVRNDRAQYNLPIAVSHRWLSARQPDDQGVQFEELLDWCAQSETLDCQAFMIDYSALPQYPRSCEEEKIFDALFPRMQSYFKRSCVVLSRGGSDYLERAWCMLELMQSSKANSLLNRPDLSGEVESAYQLAETYADHSRWAMQELRRFAPAGRLDMRQWMRDLAAMALYQAARERRTEVEDLFGTKLKLTREDDRNLVLQTLKEEFFDFF
jgi:hypothetical protein